MMDRGEFVKQKITIVPALNGGYIVLRAANEYQINGPEVSLAFSNYRDLLAFLNADYELANRPPADEPAGD